MRIFIRTQRQYMTTTVTYSYSLTPGLTPLETPDAGYTDSDPDAVRLSNGNWVGAFSYTNAGGAAALTHVVRSGVDGTILAERDLNSTTTNVQENAQLAATATGFVAVFEDLSSGTDTVRFRRFENSGTALGADVDIRPILVASGWNLQQALVNPDVAVLSNGTIAIAFQRQFGVTDGDIFVLLLDANGNHVLTIQTEGTGLNAAKPQIVALGGGGFAVAWEQLSGAGTSVHHAVYANNGAVVLAPTETDNSGTINRNLDIAATPNGGYVIAYEDNGWSTDSITLRGFDRAGAFIPIPSNPLGWAQLNPGLVEVRPSITVLDNGIIVVGVVQDNAAPASRTGGLFFFDAALNPITVPGWGGFPDPSTNSEVVQALDGGRFLLLEEGTTGLPDNTVSYAVVELLRTTMGDAADDLIAGDGMRDQIFGGGGADFILGAGGADTLNGGTGFDSVSWFTGATTGPGVVVNLTNQAFNGGASQGDSISNFEAYYLDNTADSFVNSATNAYIYCFGGNDTITGNSGTEFIDAGSGADSVNAGAGFDYASYGSSAAGVLLDLRAGGANALGAAGDVIFGVEAFYLSGQDDAFFGQAGQNFVFAGAGSDAVLGGTGSSDWLFGEDGNDTLGGGDFDDLLSGGAGSDSYFFRSWVGNGFDSVLNFTTGQDRILVNASGFGLTAGQTFTSGVNFITAASPFATQAVPTFLYATGLGILYFDADGSGAAFAPVALCQISGAPALTGADIVVTTNQFGGG